MDILRFILIVLSSLLGAGVIVWIIGCGMDGFSKVSILVGLLMISILITLIIIITNIKIPDEKSKIYSVKSYSGYEARFSIFSGYVDQEHYYLVYIKENGGYILKKYPSEQTYIFENENKNPYVVKKDAIAKDNIKYILHVPKNTIILNYRIE